MEPIYDYLGNKIKEGMTIKVIRTKPMFEDIKQMVIENGEKKFITIYKQPEKIWECVTEAIVEKGGDGILRYIIEYDGMRIGFQLSAMDWGFQKGDLLTIKGISDNKPLTQNV